MAQPRRASLAPPHVVRFWLLGLLAWGAVLFAVARGAHGGGDSAADAVSPAFTTAPVPSELTPFHVFSENRLKTLRAAMTGDARELVPLPVCDHATAHLPGAVCDDPFAGVPGLAANNGPAPPWLADLPTH